MLIFNLGGAGIKKFELHASECDEGIVLLFVYTISLWCVDLSLTELSIKRK